METQVVTNVYENQGFNITRIEGHQELSCISNGILPIPLNDYVAKVEQLIRTMKEHIRCPVQGLPHKPIPRG
jgi:hypothetical protein